MGRKPLLLLAALLPLLPPAPASGAAPSGFLVRAEIRDADPAVEFVSLLPTNRAALVWADSQRLPAWRRRVAEKLGLEPRNVGVQSADAWLEAEIVDQDLRELVSVGDIGVQEVQIRSDAGRTQTVRNEFEVMSVQGGTVRLRWRLPAGGPFVLRCGQGAGQDIRLLSGADVEARWNRLLVAGGAEAVRAEFWALKTSARVAGETDGAWRDWLLERQRATPALWPALVFANRTTEPVFVTCCGESSGRIDPGKAWTFRPEKDPGRIVWSFHTEGLRDEDFGEFPIPNWRPDGDLPELEIEVSREAKPDPFLVFGSDAIPYPAVWDALAPSGEDGRDTDLSLAVAYDDGTVDSFSGRRGAERPLRPYDFGGAGTEWVWRADLRPRKRIRRVTIYSRSYLAEYDLFLENPEYGCGDQARVRKGSAAKLLPWPKLTVRNDSPFPADFAVYRALPGDAGGEELVAEWKAVESRKSGDIPLGRLDGLSETNATLRVEISARKAWKNDRTVAVIRGEKTASAGVLAMKTEYKPLGWVGDEARLEFVDDHATWFQRDRNTRSIQNVLRQGEIDSRKFLAKCKSEIMEDGSYTDDKGEPRRPFETIRDHLSDCPVPKNCGDCTAFRGRFDRWKSRIEAVGGASASLWRESGVTTEDVAILLSLYEEYIEKYELSRTDSVEGLLRDLSR